MAAAALAACSLSAFVPSTALAEDVVVLTTGRELRGEVVEETEDRVRPDELIDALDAERED